MNVRSVTVPSFGRADARQMSIVLIVDDEPEILAAFKVYLEGSFSDVDVIAVSSAKEALDVMRETQVDLIVTDQRMRGMSGMDLLREMRSLAPDVPRVLMTAYPDVALALEAANDGRVSRFLTKPVDPIEAVEVLHDLATLRRQRRLRDAAFSRAAQLWPSSTAGRAAEG